MTIKQRYTTLPWSHKVWMHFNSTTEESVLLDPKQWVLSLHSKMLGPLPSSRQKGQEKSKFKACGPTKPTKETANMISSFITHAASGESV